MVRGEVGNLERLMGEDTGCGQDRYGHTRVIPPASTRRKDSWEGPAGVPVKQQAFRLHIDAKRKDSEVQLSTS